MYPDGYHVHNYPSGSRCVIVCVCVWPRMRACGDGALALRLLLARGGAEEGGGAQGAGRRPAPLAR